MLGYRHVELMAPKAPGTREVVADQVGGSGSEDAPDRRVKFRRMTLVAEFVYGLIGNDGVERPQALRPAGLPEAAFHERH